jgi:hypothetical protein
LSFTSPFALLLTTCRTPRRTRPRATCSSMPRTHLLPSPLPKAKCRLLSTWRTPTAIITIFEFPYSTPLRTRPIVGAPHSTQHPRKQSLCSSRIALIALLNTRARHFCTIRPPASSSLCGPTTPAPVATVQPPSTRGTPPRT